MERMNSPRSTTAGRPFIWHVITNNICLLSIHCSGLEQSLLGSNDWLWFSSSSCPMMGKAWSRVPTLKQVTIHFRISQLSQRKKHPLMCTTNHVPLAGQEAYLPDKLIILQPFRGEYKVTRWWAFNLSNSLISVGTHNRKKINENLGN